MKDKNKLVTLMSVVLLCAVFIVTALFSSGDDDDSSNKTNDKGELNTTESDEDKADYIIVVDAGHGGVDPGKVGVNGELEKDINLQIATKLKMVLENNKDISIKVIMTRESDMGHYSENDSNKKNADMKKRCEIVNNSGANLLVSIHQNSYHSESVKGAQVFYYEKSKEGHRLATSIQNQLVSRLVTDGKGRIEKSNDNYYILLNVSCPAVIVECGFLSNRDEAVKLSSEEYQQKVAEAVAAGIDEYLKK